MARLKRQFTELLSDIGFVKEGLRARDMEQRFSQGGDGVLEATGEEVTGGERGERRFFNLLIIVPIFPCFLSSSAIFLSKGYILPNSHVTILIVSGILSFLSRSSRVKMLFQLL